MYRNIRDTKKTENFKFIIMKKKIILKFRLNNHSIPKLLEINSDENTNSFDKC